MSFAHDDLLCTQPSAPLPKLPHVPKFIRPMPGHRLMTWKQWGQATEQEAAALTAAVRATEGDALQFELQSTAVHLYLSKLFDKADELFEKTLPQPQRPSVAAAAFGYSMFLPRKLKGPNEHHRARAAVFDEAHRSRPFHGQLGGRRILRRYQSLYSRGAPGGPHPHPTCAPATLSICHFPPEAHQRLESSNAQDCS